MPTISGPYVAGSAELTADPEARGVGGSPPRPDAADKLCGRFVYATDLQAEGMLWGATLRSPHPHARLLSISLEAAKAIPGVRAVLASWNVPCNRFGMIERDQPVLAEERVTYVGEPVAIVAADDPELCRRALAAIEVNYEPLEAELDPVALIGRADRTYRHVLLEHGDPSVVGEVVAEGEYLTSRQDHSFLAPDAGLAHPDGEGGVVLIGASQWVHSDQEQVAHALGMPSEKVLVRNAGIGGSFGGRVCMTWQIHAALLALETQRPVKFVYTRQETFLARYHRHPSRIWIRHHALRDGTLVKVEAKVLLEAGPYTHASPAGIGNACAFIQGAYAIPHARVEGWVVATNNGMSGSMRGFGVVQPIYACESNLDRLARVLEMDPTELRRRNALGAGERWIFDQLQDRPAPVEALLESCDRLERLEDARLPSLPASPTRPQDIHHGVALTTAAKNTCLSEGAPVNCTAMITLQGAVATVHCAAAEVGQGLVTISRQIVQDTLGVSRVELSGQDTRMPPAATTDAQQQTVTSGTAIQQAALALKRQVLRFVARLHRLDPAQLDLVDDWIVDAGGQRLFPIEEAGSGHVFRATHRFDQRPTRPLEERGSEQPMHVSITFAANRAWVELDRELGLVRVPQIDVVQDIGHVVHPLQAYGQISGGCVQGLGLVLMEHLDYQRGVPLNPDWRLYHIPTMLDAPRIQVQFLAEPEPGYPYGWKGIAETPHVAIPAAIANAIRNAAGLPLGAIPIRPEAIALGLDPVPRLQPMALPPLPKKGPWGYAPVHRHATRGPWAAGDPGPPEPRSRR
ncbi:MAG: molybdopterin cofactor-binding domain-containing protein [Synechococcus sp.]|nr:molybdopterin cofactor-binding domain-containing protein [Synechococcus sp.]